MLGIWEPFKRVGETVNIVTLPLLHLTLETFFNLRGQRKGEIGKNSIPNCNVTFIEFGVGKEHVAQPGFH